MIRIRSHTEDDLPGLVPLFRDFFTLHRQFLGGTAALNDAEAQEIVLEATSQPQSWLIVAEEGETGQLVGFARWEEREGAFFGRELFVRPEYRDRGIGTRLQEEIERQVREAGADAFFISVVPHNRPMLAFAHRRGYDTLNTVELRKELAGGQPRRGQVALFDLEFKVI
jgi:ribosomal protein S18 acetylase RimI-like enzyme